MTQSKSSGTQNQQSAHDHESEEDAAKRRAGVPEKSSEDQKSRVKAGKDEGAGGGAKQKQNH